MKKIVVVLVVFVANIVSVDAMKLEVRKEDEVKFYEYKNNKVGSKYAFNSKFSKSIWWDEK